jgi:hypothetical protein
MFEYVCECVWESGRARLLITEQTRCDLREKREGTPRKRQSRPPAHLLPIHSLPPPAHKRHLQMQCTSFPLGPLEIPSHARPDQAIPYAVRYSAFSSVSSHAGHTNTRSTLLLLCCITTNNHDRSTARIPGNGTQPACDTLKIPHVFYQPVAGAPERPGLLCCSHVYHLRQTADARRRTILFSPPALATSTSSHDAGRLRQEIA